MAKEGLLPLATADDIAAGGLSLRVHRSGVVGSSQRALLSDVEVANAVADRLSVPQTSAREFTPEGEGAARNYAAGTGDEAFIQLAVDKAYAYYAAYGALAWVRFRRKYELTAAVATWLTGATQTNFGPPVPVTARLTFIKSYPGVCFVFDQGASLHVADGLGLNYQTLVLHQDDDDHPAYHELVPFIVRDASVDYNAANNPRPWERVYTQYHGNGWRVNPNGFLADVWFDNYRSEGCQLASDIFVARFNSNSHARCGARYTRVSGKIMNYGANTAAQYMDVSAINVYSTSDGALLTEDLTIHSAWENGKRATTAIEVHGNFVAGQGTVLDGFANSINLLPSGEGASYWDTRNLKVVDALVGHNLWPAIPPSTTGVRNPPTTSVRTARLGSEVVLSPLLFVGTNPLGGNAAFAATIDGGGALATLTVSNQGYMYDPRQPPVLTLSGGGAAAEDLAGITLTPHFTAGVLVGCLVVQPGRYAREPDVLLVPSSGWHGAGATARARLDGEGRLRSIVVDLSGVTEAYDAPPNVVIDDQYELEAATATAFGTWGVASVDFTPTGNVFTSAPTVVVDDSAANGTRRANSALAPTALKMSRINGWVHEPVGLLDTKGLSVRWADVGNVAGTTFTGRWADVNLDDQATGDICFDRLLLSDWSSKDAVAAAVRISLLGTRTRSVRHLEVKRVTLDNTFFNGGITGTHPSTGVTPVSIVMTAEQVGQTIALGDNVYVGAAVAWDYAWVLNVTNTVFQKLEVEPSKHLAVAGTGSRLLGSLTGATMISKALVRERCPAAMFNGTLPDCALGSSVEVVDAAVGSWYRKVASGPTGWRLYNDNSFQQGVTQTGNASATVTASFRKTHRFVSPLTADRTETMPATGQVGDEFRVVRALTATGPYVLIVNDSLGAELARLSVPGTEVLLVWDQINSVWAIGSRPPAMALATGLASYAKAALPALPSSARAIVFVTDEVGGAAPAFWDGTNWRRFSDRAVVS
jgi:hypothetical protein